MRGGAALILGLALVGSVAAQVTTAQASDPRQRLAEARANAAAAAKRADRLATAAARERDAATRAQLEERALSGRVAAAEANLAAARARGSYVAAMMARQQARLAAAEAPVSRLLGALVSLGRRPAVALVAQPGSIDDLIHVRAVLSSALPVVRARTVGLRGTLSTTRVLAAEARAAADTLRHGRVMLEGERTRLALLEARHRAQAAALGRRAIGESDQALALGERARDLVDQLNEDGAATATAAGLAALPGPTMRPLAAGASLSQPIAGAYRLPVAGRLVTGMGEVSSAGVRARGLTLAVRPGATVVAPAAGTIRFARVFRDYGTIVIIDHGSGWSTLLTGLAAAAVRPGETVAAGTLLGRAADSDEARVTVELRRRGRPVDAAALLK